MQMDDEARTLMGRPASALLPLTLDALKAEEQAGKAEGRDEADHGAKAAACLLLVAQAALRVTASSQDAP